MASKIRIKLGSLEVEYEGEHDFLEKKLLSLMKDLMELAPSVPPPPAGVRTNSEQEKFPSGGGSGTVSTYATKLKVASGTDLILASLFHAAKVSGLESLQRDALLNSMKSAKSYYKSNFRNNLSKYLKQLVKSGEINEVATDEYAVSPKKMSEMETTSAQS